MLQEAYFSIDLSLHPFRMSTLIPVLTKLQIRITARLSSSLFALTPPVYTFQTKPASMLFQSELPFLRFEDKTCSLWSVVFLTALLPYAYQAFCPCTH